MTERSAHQKTIVATILAALGLLIVAVLWTVHGLTGGDLGVFDRQEPTHAAAWRRAAGSWYQLYFTVPQDEPNWSAGLDEVLAADIDGAEHSVDIAAYDLDLESLTDALIRAHDRGVQVRVVMDGDNAGLDQPLDLIHAGIPVVADNRSPLMHNKFVVIDGQVTWTGSWNLTDNGTYLNNNNVLRIASPELAANFGAEFSEMFHEHAFGPQSPADTPYPVLRVDETPVYTLFAPEDQVAEAVSGVVSQARDSIRFLAYSFTDETLATEMVARATDGVLVEGVFEARGTESEFSQYKSLRDAGLQVWKDGNPALMHHKVIIIDRAIVITGSFNFGASANQSNDENLLIIYDTRIAAQYLIEFDRLVAQAR